MTLKCNKHWIILQIEHTQRLKQLKINHVIINILEEINIQLREKILILQKRQSLANQSRSRQNIELQAFIENHTRQETFKSSFKSFANDHYWFYKFLNSSVFTDEDELTWEDWRNKMNDKLIVNVDQFNDETICIVYIMSRLKSDAAKHIFAWRCFDSLNSFTLIYKLFNHLKEIYDELNKNRKSQREYNILRQADKSFNVFYLIFMKLFNYLNYDDRILMNNL